jgi:hypothetical protein
MEAFVFGLGYFVIPAANFTTAAIPEARANGYAIDNHNNACASRTEGDLF